MRFTPKTEEQIAEEGLIPANTICDFEVIEAEEKLSKVGNEMMTLKLKVWRPDGSTTLLFEYLLSDADWKLRAFAVGAGVLDKYEAGVFKPDDIIGAAGKLKVGIDPAKNGYPARNKVLGYEKPAQSTARARVAPELAQRQRMAAAEIDNSDIPF
jgi:hypothetical protein